MNEENNTQFQCTGDCLKCHSVQRQYCASQHAYNSMRLLQDMQSSLTTMSGKIEDLEAKLQAIQGNEALLFHPTPPSDTSASSPAPSVQEPSPSAPSGSPAS